MEYSDDVLARVRAALIDYHAATHVNGRKRSWSAIAEELDEPLDDDDDDDDGAPFADPFKPLAEALRRFAGGTQVPSTERLDSLCRHLVAKGFLGEADLRPAGTDHPLLHAFRSFFGDDASSGSLIKGRFAASRKPPAGRNELSILTINEASHAPRVEDKLYSLPIPPQSTRRDALARLLRRTGGSEQRFDGWLFGAKGQRCLLVQDTLRGESSIYTVLDYKVPAGATPAIITLVKSRDFGLPPAGYETSLLRLTETDSRREGMLAKIGERLWEYRQEAGDDDD